MRVAQVSEVKDDVQPRRRALVLWPWALVVAAWTLAGLSVLTNQSYLINHHTICLRKAISRCWWPWSCSWRAGRS